MKKIKCKIDLDNGVIWVNEFDPEEAYKLGFFLRDEVRDWRMVSFYVGEEHDVLPDIEPVICKNSALDVYRLVLKAARKQVGIERE